MEEQIDKTESLRLLGLSRLELRVLEALRGGANTPLLIARRTKVSRPGVYEILERLKRRGIVRHFIKNGRKYWTLENARGLEEALYSVKKCLFDIEDGVEEVHGRSEATVVIHRGAEAIKKVLLFIVRDHKNERLYAVQGDMVMMGWNNVIGVEQTNELNRYIKKNGIITEALLPDDWFEIAAPVMGKQWLIDFEGRATVGHYVKPEYFKHGGQIWMFRESLFLIAMREEIIIEVRNSEIQKLILSMFRFMQDHSKKIDVNALLRTLITQEEEKEHSASPTS